MKTFGKIKKFLHGFEFADENRQKAQSRSGEASLVCRGVQTYEASTDWNTRKVDGLGFCQSNRKLERVRYSDGGFFSGFDLRVPSVVVRLKGRGEIAMTRNPSVRGIEKRVERSNSGERIWRELDRVDLAKVQSRLGIRRNVEVKRKKRILRIVDNPRNALLPINLVSKKKHLLM